jgi:hypothetical protein
LLESAVGQHRHSNHDHLSAAIFGIESSAWKNQLVVANASHEQSTISLTPSRHTALNSKETSRPYESLEFCDIPRDAETETRHPKVAQRTQNASASPATAEQGKC